MTCLPVCCRVTVLAIVVTLLWLCAFLIPGAAQNTKGSLPKVGTIKDYPGTGLTVGCGNLYFYKAEHANSTEANYVFLSAGDGHNAWMNLNGRDVRLRLVKTAARGTEKIRRREYRHGNSRITIEIDDFTPAAGDAEHMFRMKIILRNGGSIRVVRAIGDADC